MNLVKKEIKGFKLDLYIFIPIVIISIIGLITLLSTTIESNGQFGDLDIFRKQIIFFILGYILFFIANYIDVSLLKYPQVIIPIYVFTIILLVLVYLIGPVINNVQRWLVIGGIQIQPSEIAKITVILLTASIFSYKDKYNEWVLLLLSFLLVLPIFLLIYFEPAGSMSFLTLFIWFVVAFTGLSNQLRNSVALLIIGLISVSMFLISFTNNWVYILLTIASIVIAVLGFYYRKSWKIIVVVSLAIGLILGSFSIFLYSNLLKDYQKERIEAFINPTQSEQNIGFNVNQSRIAIGSGQIFGKGFGNGTQSKRNFLPEHQTDFIFASFAEEYGLVGSLFLIALYGVIIVRILVISLDKSGNTLYSIILVGIALKLLIEVFINIGTNLGVIPATGIPLPMVSAGGTITLVTLFSLGIVQSIINRSSTSLSSKSIIDNY